MTEIAGQQKFWVKPLFAFILLVIVTLACGDSAEPERVGQVEDNGEAVATVDEETVPAEDESVSEAPEEQQAEETAPATQTDTFAIGDIVSIEDMVLVVLGWEELPGDDFNQPEEGQKFIALDLMLVNQGDDAESVSSLLQMELRDDTSQRYTIDLMASAASGASSPEGELSPGERVRGKIGFQVPEDATGLQFVFDASFLGSGRVLVDLGDEPRSVAVPTELAGQTAQETYDIGEIVTLGDITLVVLGWQSPAGDDFTSPDPGMKFAVVDLILVNAGDSSENISSLLQVNLKDETDQLYDVDFMAAVAAGKSSPEGEIVPGERIRGQIGFQIPEVVQDLVFVFDADVFGTGKVFYALPLEPTAIDPPAELPGERALEMATVGEAVSTDEVAITVNEVSNPPGDGFNAPDEGNKFVVVDLTLQNQSSEALNVSSLLQMWLKDDTGQLYSIDISASVAAGGAAPEGELAPGESVRGQVGFQVPSDAQNLVFAFDNDVFSDGKVFVALP